MTSKFTEILEPSEAPTYTHPHLNVSLEDILAEEGRKRSGSESSTSSQHDDNSGSDTPKSPTDLGKAKSLRRRAFTFGNKKGRHVSPSVEDANILYGDLRDKPMLPEVFTET
ncbi:hypothetical protein CC78DRAFT_577500 [Lojkania enalia]|uniref:Uncharacterized protein n=1 Tax=Lojkania enalia TaxID=147567 RepID=A0A9P4N5E9_9PLEO|nr:hypothetical protein CC78DRAFT_577500 [Didymosphaeria enalia]